MRISVNKQFKSNNIYACMYDMFVSGHSLCWRMGSWGNQVRNLVSQEEDKLSSFRFEITFPCQTTIKINVYTCICVRVFILLKSGFQRGRGSSPGLPMNN